MQARIHLSLESLGERINPSPWIPSAGQTRQVTVVQELSPPSESLASNPGGIPSSDARPNDWVFGTELPRDASREIRHRMFAIVDRTPAPAGDDVVVDGKIITGENYDASGVVFVGGWGSSMYQYS